MKGKIDGDGTLWIERSGILKNNIVPFATNYCVVVAIGVLVLVNLDHVS